MIQENKLEIMKGNLCQVVLRVKCSDNPKKDCNSVQKYMKITHVKECNIVTDHQCKVENVQQCRQVHEQACKTVSKRVGSTESIKECLTVQECITETVHVTVPASPTTERDVPDEAVDS